MPLKYFNNDNLAASVWSKKYKKDKDLTPDDMHRRIAKEFARVDKQYYIHKDLSDKDYEGLSEMGKEMYSFLKKTPTKYIEEKYYNYLKDFKYIIPAGSPMSGIGNNEPVSLSNCFFNGQPEDSIEGIIDIAKSMAQIGKRRGGCVESNSKVIIKDKGIVLIKDVEIGDYIKSFNVDTKEDEWKRIEDKFYTEVKLNDRIEIQYSNGIRIKTSKKHPLLTLTDDGYSFHNYNSGKLDNSFNKRPNFSEFSYKENKYDEIGWWIGCHLGDGHSTTTYPLKYGFCAGVFSILGDNKEIINEYRRILGTLINKENISPVSVVKRKNYKTKCWEFRISTIDGYYIIHELLDDFSKNKTYTWSVPNFVKNNNLWVPFLAGLIDADGHIKNTGSINIDLSSKNAIDDISFFLSQNGQSYHTSIKVSKRENENNIYRLIIHKESSICKEIIKYIIHPNKKEKLINKSLISQSNSIDLTKTERDIINSIKLSSFLKVNSKPYNLLKANRININKTNSCGSAAIRLLEKYSIFTTLLTNEILSRVKVKEIKEDYNENYKYIDIVVEDNNNYYCGTNFGFVNIHNCSTDLSTLRPKGAKVNNSANESTGPIEWMELYNVIGKLVGQAGRTMAEMITLDINHPDILDFITVKQDLSKITNANISVKLNNEFIQAKNMNIDYFLKFPCNSSISVISENYEYNKLYEHEDILGNPCFIKKVKAKEIWDKLIFCAWNTAEPGLLNWTRVIDYDPTSIYDKLKPMGTNPCCFSVDSRVDVITNNGIKDIKDVTKHDLVWVDSENMFKENTGYFKVGKYPVYKVEFTNGSILEITENHKLGKIKPKRIGNKQNKDFFELTELKNLKIGDEIATPKNSINGFGLLGNYHEGLLLGWLTGDGCLSYKDETCRFPNTILDFWEKEHDIIPNFIEAGKSIGLDLHVNDMINNDNNVKRLSSSNITKYFTEKYEFNIWKFKNGKNLFLYNASKDFLKGYLSAYFTADGCIINNSEISSHVIELSSTDKIRLEQIQIILNLFNIRSSIYLSKKEQFTSIRGVFYPCKKCYKLSITGLDNIKNFHEEIKFLSFLKQNNLNKLVLNNSKRITYNYTKIKSIDFIGEKEVGCIEVPNYNNFVANSVISGNSELPLGKLDSCRLISTNLYSLVNEPFTNNSNINEEKAYEVFYYAQVLTDLLVDLEIEAIDRILNKIEPKYEKYRVDLFGEDEEKKAYANDCFYIDFFPYQSEEFKLWWNIREIGKLGRRTGTGVTALGDMYAALNLEYGDENITDKIFEIKYKAEWNASIDLAIIKGKFPLWDKNLEFVITKENDHIIENIFGKNSWYQEMINIDPLLVLRMIKYGRRNSGISTVAPNGSLSLMTQTTSGIEPLFEPWYIRRTKAQNYEIPDFIDDNGVSFKEYPVVHEKLKTFAKTITNNIENYTIDDWKTIYEKSPYYNQCANNIDYKKRIKTQSIIQKYISSSISSTINLANSATVETIDEIYTLSFESGLKGETVYRDGCRSGVLVTDNKPKELSLERPKEIECKVVHFNNEGNKWLAFVGEVNGQPYEIFTGPKDLEIFPVPGSVNHGKIIKTKDGDNPSRYDFRYTDSYGYNNTLGGLSRIFNKEYWNYARFVSGLLRSNVNILEIIKIVDSLNFEEKSLNNWKSGVIRSLKGYIPDGTKSLDKCSECGGILIFENGCQICKSCGNSKCG